VVNKSSPQGDFRTLPQRNQFFPRLNGATDCAKEKPADSAGGLSNQSRHWTGPQYLKVTRSALSFILTTAKIIVKNPPP
jgi:hypothetical protein